MGKWMLVDVGRLNFKKPKVDASSTKVIDWLLQKLGQHNIGEGNLYHPDSYLPYSVVLEKLDGKDEDVIRLIIRLFLEDEWEPFSVSREGEAAVGKLCYHFRKQVHY